MKAVRKTKLTFAVLPRDYAGLCRVFTPPHTAHPEATTPTTRRSKPRRPIRDKTGYANTVEVTDAMALHAADFSADQEDYFDVLCILIEARDAR